VAARKPHRSSRDVTPASYASADELRDALLSLTPAQQLVIEILLTGGTHAAAADAAGVARETVSRWLGNHLEFRAVLDVHRSNLATEQARAVQGIRGRALAIVAEHLDDASMSDALAVLRVVGSPGGGPETVPLRACELLEAERVRTRAILPALPPSDDPYADAIDDFTGVAATRERDRVERLMLARIASAAGYDLLGFED
jgi:hypothetical protein